MNSFWEAGILSTCIVSTQPRYPHLHTLLSPASLISAGLKFVMAHYAFELIRSRRPVSDLRFGRLVLGEHTGFFRHVLVAGEVLLRALDSAPRYLHDLVQPFPHVPNQVLISA